VAKGILDWVFDFLVKPIANEIKAIVAEPSKAIELVSPITKIHDALRALAPMIIKVDEQTAPASVDSPEAAEKIASELRGGLNTEMERIADVLMTIESGSLGLVDISPEYAVNLPSPIFLRTIATAMKESRFRSGFIPYYERYWLSQYRPMLPEPYRLALAASKNIPMPMDYYQAMAENGLTAEWADVWRDQNYEYPSFGQIAELYWRGIIDDAMFTALMERSGQHPALIDTLKELTKLIPPSSDLITMVVREAFLPEMVVPAPDIFAEYMVKKGFSKEWSDRYWTAHFVPIPLGQAYDNLRRGYWTKEQFMFALHIADIHPMWREDIYKVAWNPLTIRELGYAYDVGAVTRDDIVKYRRWGGLSLEDAEKAADSLIAYRTEAEREAVRREHLHLFALGKEDELTFLSHLTRLGTASPAIPLWVERGKLEAERKATEPAQPEQRIISSSEALYAFRNGIKDEAWTRLCLLELNWTQERIDLAIQRIKFELAQEEAEAEVDVAKKLSISLIRDYLKHGFISETQVPLFLHDLGYGYDDSIAMAAIMAEEVYEELKPKPITEADAENLYDMRLLGLSDHDAVVKFRTIAGPEGVDSPTLALFNFYRDRKYSEGDSARLTLMTGVRFAFPDLKAMYSKGWIGVDTLINELVRLGLPQKRASELAMTVVKSKQPARTVTEKDLTKAEIIKGWKVGIVTTNEAIGLLVGLGYDQFEAEYVLAINAITAKSDPEGYWEMRAVVEASKKARGLPSIEIPADAIRLEAGIKATKQQLEKLKAEKAPEEAIGEVAVRLAGLETELRQLVISKKLQ